MCNHGSVNCVVFEKSFAEKAEEAETRGEEQAVEDRTAPRAAKKQKTQAWASGTTEFDLQAVTDRKKRFAAFLAHVTVLEHRRQCKRERFGQILDPVKLSTFVYCPKLHCYRHRNGGY